MIVGIGTDIVDIVRITKIIKKNNRFSKKILTISEHNVYNKFNSELSATHFLAKRWAAKEAVSKALGTGMAQGVGFQQIEVLNNELGQPHIYLTGTALKKSQILNIKNWQISISDEQKYAVCFVIAEA